MEQNMNVNDKQLNNIAERRKRWNLILIIIIVLLAIGAAYLYNLNQQQKKEAAQIQQVLEDEKDKLTNELKGLMNEYEALKSDNDSMNRKLEEQQDRIKKLLAINASNVEKINLYKKELVTLREIMKSYIVQIDSLNRRNMQLVEENKDVKERLDQARKSNEELTQVKEELTQKVKQASILSAKDIVVTPLNRRSKDTDRASRVAKIKTCFTIRENTIVQPGRRIVYCRITRPDQLVFTSSENNLFDFQGQQIVFSEKREVDYENADVDVCIYYAVKEGEMIPGQYSVDLFTDGNLIGSTTFVLK